MIMTITFRKGREYRIFKEIKVVADGSKGLVKKVESTLKDYRSWLKSDSRVLGKLPRRIFITDIAPDGISCYISFYVEAVNKDMFMSIQVRVKHTCF